MGTEIREIPGISLDLWSPDEEIFHKNINKRERRFGGHYQTTNIGSTTLAPIFTQFVAGQLFGEFIFGFGGFDSVIGAGLILDSIVTGEIAPTYSEELSGGLFGNTEQFGFLSFGFESPITDILATGEIGPSYISGLASGSFGSSFQFGFMMFADTEMGFEDTITTGDIAPTFVASAPGSFTFGGFSFGFGVFVA